MKINSFFFFFCAVISIQHCSQKKKNYTKFLSASPFPKKFPQYPIQWPHIHTRLSQSDYEFVHVNLSTVHLREMKEI